MPRLTRDFPLSFSPADLWQRAQALIDHEVPPIFRLLPDAQYRYTLLGIPVKGAYAVVESEAPRYIIIRTLGGIEAIFELAFEPQGQGSRLILTADYALPGALLGGSTHRPALEAQIEADVAAALGWLETHLNKAE